MKKLTEETLREAVAFGTNVARREAKRKNLYPYNLGERLALKKAKDVSPEHVLALRETLRFLGVTQKASTMKGKA